MILARAGTMTGLWHGTVKYLFFARTGSPIIDHITSVDTISYDNVLSCGSMIYDFDAGRDLWLPASRFTKLKRDYLEPDELASFLDRCEKIGTSDWRRGVQTMMHSRIHPRRHRVYQWGNCMIGWTFRMTKKQPVLAMHSRVAYISYMAGMDLALCHILARTIGERIDVPVEDFSFRWCVDSLQLHNLKSIPYMQQRSELMDAVEDRVKFPSDEYPTIRKIRIILDRFKNQELNGNHWSTEKFAPQKRVRRRRYQWMNGDKMPPVPLSSLNLENLE